MNIAPTRNSSRATIPILRRGVPPHGPDVPLLLRNKVSLHDSYLRRHRILAILILAPFWLIAAASEASSPDPLRDARTAFEHRQYDKALALIDALSAGSAGEPSALQLKARALARSNRPQDALVTYDQLQDRLGREDLQLLREVAFSFITVVLTDMREQMRGAGYTALKEWASEETLPYLEDGLSDGSGLVRALAVEGLGRLKAGRRSLRVRKALEDQAAIVRTAAVKVLGQSGDRAVVSLVEGLLKDDQAGVRLEAAGTLVMLGNREALDMVRQAAVVPNPEERAAALRMLGYLKDTASLNVLQQSLKDPQPSIRGAAAAGLGDLGLRDAVPALTQGLSDTIPAVRVSAAVSLGELSATDAAPALSQALGDVSPAVRAAAASALFRLGRSDETTIRIVRELAHSSDPGMRAAAARSLARTKARGPQSEDSAGASAIAILNSLLDDPVPRPRIAAARSLGQIGGKEQLPELKRSLRDQDEAVRATAAGALGRILSSRDES